MKKSFQSTLVLLLVFAGLVAWYLIYEKRIKVDRAQREEQAKTLVKFAQDDLQEIKIEQRRGEGDKAKYATIRFKRMGAEWNLVEPVEDLAEGPAIAGLLNALTTTQYDRIVDEAPEDLTPFGLHTPLLKIRASKDSATASPTLLVGDDTPTGMGVYVKFEQEPQVYRAPQLLRTSFDKEASEYRNKKVLSISRADILEAEAKIPSGSYVLQRQGTSENWLLAREELPASETQVNKVLNTLVALRAERFASESAGSADLARFGLSPAPVAFDFKTEKGKVSVQVGRVKDKVYAKSSDRNVILEVAPDTFDKVATKAEALQDKSVVRFNRFDVNRIEIAHGPESFELVKGEAGWTLGGEDPPKIETEKVEDFLSRLQDVRVQSFGGKKPGAKQPDLAIRLFGSKGEGKAPLAHVRIQKPKGKTALGERDDLAIGFSLSEADFKKINAFKQEFLAPDKKAENKADSGKS